MNNVVLCIVALVVVTPATGSEERNFVSLFDGKTLQGWVYVGKREQQLPEEKRNARMPG